MLRAFFFAIPVIMMLVTVRDVARAETCAEAPVTARGEQSRYTWMAKVKMRANWRAKVRSLSGLGPDYSNPARAKNAEERCLTGDNGSVCIFTGTPCRP
jgi:hypothetical protein